MKDSAVNGRHFNGTASVFGQRTAIGNPLTTGFYEFVNRSAFDKTLRSGDVVMLADHDPGKPLARTSAGTLKIRVDTVGLHPDVPALPNTTYANDLIENVRVGNVRGMSFGFEVIEDDWRVEQMTSPAGQTVDVEVRELLEVRLVEVSTTAFPAYPGTDADVRSAFRTQSGRLPRGAINLRLRSRALAARYGLPMRKVR